MELYKNMLPATLDTFKHNLKFGAIAPSLAFSIVPSKEPNSEEIIKVETRRKSPWTPSLIVWLVKSCAAKCAAHHMRIYAAKGRWPKLILAIEYICDQGKIRKLSTDNWSLHTLNKLLFFLFFVLEKESFSKLCETKQNLLQTTRGQNPSRLLVGRSRGQEFMGRTVRSGRHTFWRGRWVPICCFCKSDDDDDDDKNF